MNAEYLRSARNKLGEIYNDLTANVTRIYSRGPVHLAYDLVAHSILGFTFKGERVTRGWVEGLLIGDTRVGKSQIAERLLAHGGLGRHVNCERVSFAGLVGGMQQIGKTWNINWGIIPLYDRQLVVLDEASGLSLQQIGEMSGLRSSGIAEIVKIQQERTPARCRLLWIMNRRKDHDNRIDDLPYGVKAVSEGMGRVEDIARLDFAMVLSQSDVPSEIMNAKVRTEVPHVYTSDMAHNLLLWAWSRKPDDVVFVGGCEDFILDQASEISRKYSSEIPLVERSEQRIRIARLACAMAARLFSTDETHKKLLVREEHVQMVLDFLTLSYNARSMRYDKFSQARSGMQSYKQEEIFDGVDRIKRFQAESLPALVAFLNENEEFDRIGLAEATGWELETARQFVQLFTTKCRGLRPGGNRKLVKTPLMVQVLKQLEV